MTCQWLDIFFFISLLTCLLLCLSQWATLPLSMKNSHRDTYLLTHGLPQVSPWGREPRWCPAAAEWGRRQWWAERRQTWSEVSLYRFSSCFLPGSERCGLSGVRSQKPSGHFNKLLYLYSGHCFLCFHSAATFLWESCYSFLPLVNPTSLLLSAHSQNPMVQG